MKRRILITVLCGLVVAIVYGFYSIKIDRPADYEAFRTIVQQSPLTYRDLERMVSEYIYPYKTSDKGDFLGEIEPVNGDIPTTLLSDKSVVMYRGCSIGDISYSCYICTFSVDFFPLPQCHEMYFNRTLDIIGYRSNWLADQ